ncbi:MAG: hypothetical protein DSZ29_04025 [Aquificaceae bacterium]|nr:MAG: hypothetical protein DSZ29_04025 [Aquificaceae bacterium]
MLRSGDFSLSLQGFRSRLNFYSFAKSLNGYEFISFASPVDPNQRKGDQLPAFSCASQVKMGRAKTRYAQTACPADLFLLANARRS